MSKVLRTHPLRKALHPLSFCILLFSFLFTVVGLQAANRTTVSPGGTPVVLPGGNFESPALSGSPGYAYRPASGTWTYNAGAGLSRNGTGFTAGNPNAPQGAQVLFLQGQGAISQSVDFVAGSYTFNLKAAQRGNHQTTSQTMQLRIDGVTIRSMQPSGTGYQSFTTVPVNLTSGAHTIELRGTSTSGDNTIFVDEFKYTRLKEVALSGFEKPALPASPGFQYNPAGGPWTFTNGGGLSRNNSGFTAGNPNAPQGSQVLFLQGGGSASLPVVIAQAGYYRYRFKAAIRGNNPTQPAQKNVRITVNNIEVGEFSLPNSSYNEMVSLAVYLPVGTHTLTLKGVNPSPGDHTGLVDNLRQEMLLDWQDPQAWGGTVPNSNDVATVASGSAVVMRNAVYANRIIVNGDLVAAQNRDVSIYTKNIMAMGSNALIEWGQELNPYPKKASLNLNATPADPDIGSMGNKFLVAMNGGTLQMHGLAKKSWTQLGQNFTSGNQIVLKEAVNWSVGDEIVVVASRTNWNEAEKRSITGISGNTLTLNSPLNYPHTGVVKNYSDGSRNWTADLRAEVGLLTHNIKVQGSSPGAAGYGGHIMIHSNGYAYVTGVELYNMGQKAILGKYPFHWHMLGNIGVGQCFKNSSVHQSYNRAITIHGTESTLVENNFFYDHIGHGVFLEDGSERYNVIRKNVTLLSKRPAPGEELTPSDNQFDQVQNRTPSSYWITNPHNTFEDNVAAGTQGTGYWFAFPKKPMGLSATDPRFSSLEPYKMNMIAFERNSAHSCRSGFDIFDQLSPAHAIIPNAGWANNAQHYMDDCLWYANDLGLYSGIGAGGPSTNLVFRNNVLVENKVGTMFASYCQVDQSVIVANSGENLVGGERFAYRVYDGAGQVRNSHFIGWNASNANLLINTGAGIKHPNNIFSGNTKNHAGPVRCALPNFDIAPTYAHANHPAHPRFWSVVLRDITGGISGKANTTIVGNQPFQLVGDEFQPANWTNTYRSDHQFVLARLTYDLSFSQHPNIVVTRTKPGTPSPSIYYVDGYKEWHQLPLIVNEGFEYTYQYEALPASKVVRVNMDDATSGDDFIARFKDFGKLGGLSMGSTQGSFPSYGSLASLKNASSSGYYRQSGGDLYIKAVATGKSQRFDISWSTNFTVPKIDTDGDQMADAQEIDNGRHAFDAFDLEAKFDAPGDFEGWSGLVNISGGNVSGGALKGTSINNGDAMVINNAYNFDALRVPRIQVRMKASRTTAVQIFFATSAAPGFSGSRVMTQSYTGGGAWQTLTFPMEDHASWANLITNLRLDVVSGTGISFEVDWIRADGASKTAAFAGDAGANAAEEPREVAVYPNPMQDRLVLDLGTAGLYTTVRLTDLQGRVLRSEQVDASTQQMVWSFADQALPAGIYLVQFVGATQRAQVKVVKYDR